MDNIYCEKILSIEEAIECLYNQKSINKAILSDLGEVLSFNKYSEFFNPINDSFALRANEEVEDIAEFHKKRQETWFLPKEYLEIDLEEFLLSLCKNDIEVNRVKEELVLFKQHDLETVLKFLIYFITTLRENNAVWGVGRGSSVASYCLFLIGVHKVDSLKYELDIKEFLK